MRKSLVLLKNGKTSGEPILPLSRKAKKILVAGSNADNLGYQCGGWTIQWQGLSGNNLTIGELSFISQWSYFILSTFLLSIWILTDMLHPYLLRNNPTFPMDKVLDVLIRNVQTSLVEPDL